MMLKSNALYGFITNGDRGGRPTNNTRIKINDYADKIIRILAPLTMDDESLCHRAELLVKIAMTDDKCTQLIGVKDPYNTYYLTEYVHEASDIDIPKISQELQKLGLPGDDIVITDIHRIILALRQILQVL